MLTDFGTGPDDLIYRLGYAKTNEDQWGVEYVKTEETRGGNRYIHKVDILKKASGKYLLQSYGPNQFDKNGIVNTCVGLTVDEIEAFYIKMKQLETCEDLLSHRY